MRCAAKPRHMHVSFGIVLGATTTNCSQQRPEIKQYVMLMYAQNECKVAGTNLAFHDFQDKNMVKT
jgi:zona occludens toxin (predicted ATPase)